MPQQDAIDATAWLEMAHAAAVRLNRRQALEERLHEIVDLCREGFAADSCLLYLLDERTHELVLRASSNAHPDQLGTLRLRIGEGITGWVAQQRQPVAIDSAAGSDPRFKFYSSLPEDAFEAFLSIPVVAGTRVLGVVNVQHRAPHEHHPLEIKAAAALAMFLAAALVCDQWEARCLEAERALADRKVIERAKGVLQQEQNLSEEEAYQRLKHESRRSRRPMAEIAQALLTSRALHPRGQDEAGTPAGNGLAARRDVASDSAEGDMVWNGRESQSR